MVDVRFSRPAMWLTTVTFSLAACGVGAPSLPIEVPVPSTAAEAPTGFDNRSNGAVDDSTHQADQDAFYEVEEIAGGLPETRWAVSQRRHPDRARHRHHLRSHARQRSGHLSERGVSGLRDSR